MSKFIYMDNAATTAVRQEVVDAMVPYFTESYANPSSVYSFAQKTKNDMEEARETIASILGAAKPNEIYFTGGGSESDNWALKAAAEAFKSKGHAGFADSGYDIICAGVSALVINFINSAEELCHAEYSLDTDEETGMIDYRLDKPATGDVALLMDSMILGLKGIQRDYGNEYIILDFKEV